MAVVSELIKEENGALCFGNYELPTKTKLDGFDFQTTFTAMAATLNNTGPGFSEIAAQTGELTIDIGPIGNYDAFSPLSKIVLILSMLIGRLEIYPILMLFNPRVWSKKM